MGVRNLWRLLLPIGRRISIETLSNKTLAIDTSIWLTQFLKAMRDDDGRTIPAAHLIGFLRRICKLMYHNIKAVFVFEGATPEIKLKELRERRRRRMGDGQEGEMKRLAKRILAGELKRLKRVGDGATNKKYVGDGCGDGGQRIMHQSFMDDDDNNNSNDKSDVVVVVEPSKDGNDVTTTTTTIQNPKDVNESSSSQKSSPNNNDNNLDCDYSPPPSPTTIPHRDDTRPNDWTTTSQKSPSPPSSPSSVDIPSDSSELSFHALQALPSTTRSEIFTKAKRRQRLRSRKEFLPHAAHPEKYSQIQLANFLRGSRLNKKMVDVAKAVAGRGEGGEEGVGMASDARRRIVLRKGESSEESEESEEEGGFIVDSPEYGRVDNDERNDDDDDGCGFIADDGDDDRRNGVKPKPTFVSQRAILEDSEMEDNDAEEEEGGFLPEEEEGSDVVVVERVQDLTKDDHSMEMMNGSDEEDEGGGFLHDPDDMYAAASRRKEQRQNNNVSRNDNDGAIRKDKNESAIRKDVNGSDDDVGGGFLPDSDDENAKTTNSITLEESQCDNQEEVAAVARCELSSSMGGNLKPTSVARRRQRQILSDETLAKTLQSSMDDEEETIRQRDGSRKISSSTMISCDDDDDDEKCAILNNNSTPLIKNNYQQRHDDDDDDDVDWKDSLYEDTPSPRSEDDGNDEAVIEKQPEPTTTKTSNEIVVDMPLLFNMNGSSDSSDTDDDINWEDGNVSSNGRNNVIDLSRTGAEDDAIIIDGDNDERSHERSKSKINSEQIPAELELESNGDNDEDDDDEDDINWEDGDVGDEAAVVTNDANKSMTSRTRTEDDIEVDNVSKSKKREISHCDDFDAGIETKLMEVKNNTDKNVFHVNDDDDDDGKCPSKSEDDDDVKWQDADDMTSIPSENDNDPQSNSEIPQRGIEINFDRNDDSALSKDDDADFKESPSQADDNNDDDDDDDDDDTIAMSNAATLTNDSKDNATTVDDTTVAALRRAEATALNLTQWAGRAVRRAIAEHVRTTASPTAATTTTTQSRSFDDANAAEANNRRNDDNDDTTTIKDLKTVGITTTSSPSSTSLATENKTTTTLDDSSPPHAQTLTQDLYDETLLLEAELLSHRKPSNDDDSSISTIELQHEIIQLLHLLGVPYAIAPAEAEAQCAALEKLHLVDGIVTEDSDAFVFGGTTVYKNIFQDEKYVEVYDAGDAKREMGLGGEEFVALAMLLGGDYTEGVKGVGIVNGMEVVKSFDFETSRGGGGGGVMEGLGRFKRWLDGFEPEDDDKLNDVTTKEGRFRAKHRAARMRWEAPPNFPSEMVYNAYANPVVDRSKDKFSWGVVDDEGLRRFCERKMGWSGEETDRLIMPVLNKIRNEGSNANGDGTMQTRIDSYFMTYKDNIKFASVRSKRLKDILMDVKHDEQTKRTTTAKSKKNDKSDSSTTDEKPSKSDKKRRGSNGDDHGNENDDDEPLSTDSFQPPQRRRQRRRRAAATTTTTTRRYPKRQKLSQQDSPPSI